MVYWLLKLLNDDECASVFALIAFSDESGESIAFF